MPPCTEDAQCPVGARCDLSTGVCGTASAPGGPEAVGDAGPIWLLQDEIPPVGYLALQDNTLYTAFEGNPGVVVGFEITGGSAGTVFGYGDGTEINPEAIAVDRTNVYWADQGSSSSSSADTVWDADGAIVQSPLDGSHAPITLASGQVHIGFSDALAVDAHDVYWVAAGSGNNAGIVASVPIGGGTITTLARDQAAPWAIAVNATTAYWLNGGTVNADGRYNDDGAVLSTPIGGGAVSTLAARQENPWFIAVDDQNLYWTNEGSEEGGSIVPATGSVVQLALSGGLPITLATGQNAPVCVQVGPTSVYWANFGDGTVATVGIGGGTTATLARSADGVIGLVADTRRLFFSATDPSGTGGAVYELVLIE